MPKGKKTVANFGQKMIDLFRAGSQKPITVSFDTLGKAYSFSYRMNRLRQAMRDEGHWVLPMAEGCQVSLDKSTKSVTIRPADFEFENIIDKAFNDAGVDLPEDSSPRSGKEDQSNEINSANDALEEFFKKGK